MGFIAIQLTSQSTAAALCSGLLRRPFVALATTGGSVSEIDYVARSRLAGLRRKLLGRAAWVMAQTDAAAEDLERLVPRAGVTVLPNPVEDVEPSPLTGEPRVAFTGRLSEEKDLGRLLEAWRGIAEEQPDATLTLVGAGGNYRSVEAELRAQASGDQVLARSVAFTGWVEDVEPYLREADVYVLPSVSEGMSNALLEACAHGRVVVASGIPGNRAVLGDDYPLLFPSGDTSALEAVLRRALYDREVRAEAVERARRAVTVHAVDAVAERLERLIEDAAHSSRN